MKVKINKPCRVNLLSGECEVTQQEYDRLLMLGLLEKEVRETPEVSVKKETRKKK